MIRVTFLCSISSFWPLGEASFPLLLFGSLARSHSLTHSLTHSLRSVSLYLLHACTRREIEEEFLRLSSLGIHHGWRVEIFFGWKTDDCCCLPEVGNWHLERTSSCSSLVVSFFGGTEKKQSSRCCQELGYNK